MLHLLVLRQAAFASFEPIGLCDHGFLAVAEPKDSVGKLEDKPAWLSPGAVLPYMHVAVFQKDEVVVTVELDPHSFDAEEASELVESMKPAVKELRRLAPR